MRKHVFASLVWLAATAALTAVMVYGRVNLDKAHIALLFLLLVLFASAYAGRVTGLVIAIVTFACFNFFFLPPRFTLSVGDPRDLLILATYLVTALVAANLFHRVRLHAALTATRLEADRFKDALLATVSHDLRTPLTTIKAAAHDIGAEGDERAVRIEEAADHLERLVGDLLDLSRIKAGELTVTPELNAAEDLIGAALRQVTPYIGTRDVEVHIDANAPVLVGRFDFVYSLRILVNLIENAHRYSPFGSSIEVSADRAGQELVFRVADAGPGIPESEREHIYEAFYRADANASDGRGAGLGLSIARRLAEMQGGRLSHEPRPGGGTVFSFRVPAADS